MSRPNFISNIQSKKALLKTSVYVNDVPGVVFTRYSWTWTLGAKTGILRTAGISESEPNSDGMKRLTPAAIAASTRIS